MPELYTTADGITWRNLFEVAEQRGFADKPIIVEDASQEYGYDVIHDVGGIVVSNDGEARLVIGATPEELTEEYKDQGDDEDEETNDTFEEVTRLEEDEEEPDRIVVD